MKKYLTLILFICATASAAIIWGNQTIKGNLSVAGNSSVTGTSTLTGNTGVTGTLTVTGTTALNGGLGANLKLNNLWVSNDGGSEGISVADNGDTYISGDFRAQGFSSTATNFYGRNNSISGTNSVGGDLIFNCGIGTGTGACQNSFWVPVLQASGSTAQSSMHRALTISPVAGSLSKVVAQDTIWSPELCDENGSKCNDLSAGINATTGLTGTVPIANGGTNNASLSVSAGVVYYGDGSKLMGLAAGTSGQVLTSGGAGAPSWTTGSAGGTNEQREYITNGKFATDVSDWTTYDDAAAAPVDCTGGSLTTTFTRGTALDANGNGILTKDAANRQGEGVAIPFTLDKIDYSNLRAIPISIQTRTSSSYATGDVLIYVYDMDAGGSPQPIATTQSTTPGTVSASSGGTTWTGTFYPTTSSSDNYRLCIHNATTNASAWDLEIDNVHVGNLNLTPGAFLSEYGTETWTDNQANATTSVNVHRDGAYVEVVGTVTYTGADSGALTITIPTTYTADSTYYNFVANGVGWGETYDSGAFASFAIPSLQGANTLGLPIENSSSGSYGTLTNIAATVPFTWASGDTVKFYARWKVSGWAASAALSTTESMLTSVHASYTMGGTQDAANVLAFDTKVYDTHNAVTTGASWKFTAPKTAKYRVSWVLQGASAVAMSIYKNGSAFDNINDLVANVAVGGSYTIALTKGDYIHLQGSSSAMTESSCHIEIDEEPDFSIFSVYGPFEVQSATSSEKTPSAGGHYHDLTGNTLVLSAGTWRLFASAKFGNGGVSPTYASVGVGIYGADGADSSSQPAALSTLSGVTVLSTNASHINHSFSAAESGNNSLVTGPFIIRTTASSTTVYGVTYSNQTTSSNARITVYINAERLQ